MSFVWNFKETETRNTDDTWKIRSLKYYFWQFVSESWWFCQSKVWKVLGKKSNDSDPHNFDYCQQNWEPWKILSDEKVFITLRSGRKMKKFPSVWKIEAKWLFMKRFIQDSIFVPGILYWTESRNSLFIQSRFVGAKNQCTVLPFPVKCKKFFEKEFWQLFSRNKRHKYNEITRT